MHSTGNILYVHDMAYIDKCNLLSEHFIIIIVIIIIIIIYILYYRHKVCHRSLECLFHIWPISLIKNHLPIIPYAFFYYSGIKPPTTLLF